ncbi:MAG TPA: DUF4412 domain-containing protein [Rudaea sp.]|nr:DUF4412 domain-containing protein [Rudaea sp.]
MRQCIALCIALFGCALSASVHADFRAEFATVKGDGDYAMTRFELSGTHLRMDSGKVSMLVDTGKDSFIVLMNDKREYMDLGKMAESMNAMLANVPPQMREMMKQRMAAHGSNNLSYASTGQTGEVGGLSCEVYAMTYNSQHNGDACLASATAAGISGADEAALHRAFEQMRAMASKASAGMVHTGIVAMPAGKFPVRITRYDDGKVAAISELKQLSSATAPAGDFAIPAGYNEMQMPAFGAPH